jgi:hypothetical protein
MPDFIISLNFYRSVPKETLMKKPYPGVPSKTVPDSIVIRKAKETVCPVPAVVIGWIRREKFIVGLAHGCARE